MANLKNATVAELLKLRSDVDAMLLSKREELHAQLREISGDTNGARKPSNLTGKKVAPKYRHPKTGEEWSGRGGMVKWLAAEIKAGKKKDDFLIAKAVSRKQAVKRSKKK